MHPTATGFWVGWAYASFVRISKCFLGLFIASAVGVWLSWTFAFAGGWVAPYASAIEIFGLISYLSLVITGVGWVIVTVKSRRDTGGPS